MDTKAKLKNNMKQVRRTIFNRITSFLYQHNHLHPDALLSNVNNLNKKISPTTFWIVIGEIFNY